MLRKECVSYAIWSFAISSLWTKWEWNWREGKYKINQLWDLISISWLFVSCRLEELSLVGWSKGTIL